MLDKWLTKYSRPFIRASPLAPKAPTPSALRSQLKDFLDRATTTSSTSSSQDSWFEKELASLRVSFDSLPVVVEEECSEPSSPTENGFAYPAEHSLAQSEVRLAARPLNRCAADLFT
jgi:hypothetical protein